jgi:hypothetical protein
MNRKNGLKILNPLANAITEIQQKHRQEKYKITQKTFEV